MDRTTITYCGSATTREYWVWVCVVYPQVNKKPGDLLTITPLSHNEIAFISKQANCGSDYQGDNNWRLICRRCAVKAGLLW